MRRFGHLAAVVSLVVPAALGAQPARPSQSTLAGTKRPADAEPALGRSPAELARVYWSNSRAEPRRSSDSRYVAIWNPWVGAVVRNRTSARIALRGEVSVTVMRGRPSVFRATVIRPFAPTDLTAEAMLSDMRRYAGEPRLGRVMMSGTLEPAAQQPHFVRPFRERHGEPFSSPDPIMIFEVNVPYTARVQVSYEGEERAMHEVTYLTLVFSSDGRVVEQTVTPEP